MTRVRSFRDHMKQNHQKNNGYTYVYHYKAMQCSKNEVKVLRLRMILAMPSPKVHKG